MIGDSKYLRLPPKLSSDQVVALLSQTNLTFIFGVKVESKMVGFSYFFQYC